VRGQRVGGPHGAGLRDDHAVLLGDADPDDADDHRCADVAGCSVHDHQGPSAVPDLRGPRQGRSTPCAEAEAEAEGGRTEG
jgi:hypothetical protein